MTDIEKLRVCVDYDASTGALTFKAVPADFMQSGKRSAFQRSNLRNALCVGKPAFNSESGNGYRKGMFLGRKLYAHRVAWAITHGAWPNCVDHINGDKSDNRLANLRSVSVADNARNAVRPASNTSGVVGVRWSKPCAKWSARIFVDRAEKHLGVFDRFEDAVAARRIAEQQFGFHPNHGRDPQAINTLGRL